MKYKVTARNVGVKDMTRIGVKFPAPTGEDSKAKEVVATVNEVGYRALKSIGTTKLEILKVEVVSEKKAEDAEAKQVAEEIKADEDFTVKVSTRPKSGSKKR